jgi:hypothetical protein
MNGTLYMQWLHNRLLPSFAARYPGRKMILVLDNAATGALQQMDSESLLCTALCPLTALHP